MFVFGWLSVVCYSYLIFSVLVLVFLFKQKTAYEMRISDWSSDVCSSDLHTDRRSASISVCLNMRAFGHPRSTALTISASLAQIGEFAFIIAGQIGRASCRERVCTYVLISGVAV